MLKKIIHELNYIKWYDIYQIFVFLVSLPFILIYKIIIKINKKEIWLISEDKNEARDNGFCFFKYLNLNYPNEKTYYAINYKSNDYDKVRKIGKTVKYGSIWHWVLYFNAKYNVSSQKAGNPDAAICYVLEVILKINTNKFFLQHGITLNKSEWLFYQNTNIKMFICGAKPEYEYVKKYFGYPEEQVKYLGFSRFDDYHNIKVNNKQILLIPSWREWISSKNEYSNKYENSSVFTKTEYFKKYQELINDKDLIEFLNKNDTILYFYPHRNMQKYINDFSVKTDKIKIVTNKNSDIRKLLIESTLMITDYSSVAMDFAYMKKPVIYYQFDEEKFREAQYSEGYFDYKNSGIGTVVKNVPDIMKLLNQYCKNNYKLNKENLDKINSFFTLNDKNNSERIYNEIKK